MRIDDVVKSNPYVLWQRHCKSLPDGEVFRTSELCRALNITCSATVSYPAMTCMKMHTTTVGRSRYWGNAKTIKKLRAMEAAQAGVSK